MQFLFETLSHKFLAKQGQVLNAKSMNAILNDIKLKQTFKMF